MNQRILVVGGAGYIGSHMVKCLVRAGESVVTLDNLSTGHRDAILGGEFIRGDINDAYLLSAMFTQNRFDTVMHFASLIQVGESVADPARYYLNNVAGTVVLLNAMAQHRVPHFVFSSTAAIFGEPQTVPIDEDHPQVPINPYGRSKWLIEQLLPDYERAYGLRSVCLRYFNAAGADPEGELGEQHDPETHLIPLALQSASGRQAVLTVYGDDYDTDDGTCVRDYVHVADLCDAHLRAVRYLRGGGESAHFNLGNGAGYSVREVLRTVERVTGCSLPVEAAPRRPGDPVRLVADAARARGVLGWKPRYNDLDTIVRHAWHWERRVNGPGQPERPIEPSWPSRPHPSRGA